ncbi:putative synaptobrevin [Chaetomidium leptoderma]|uniref:Synaptobrevin n=1 Tax=Chaetomidium leptoderma TaxID=669021 RepID=A0AAN6VDC4_9PEZI|nr:putative synaptobrevin [Chaetomidium leptoderma]
MSSEPYDPYIPNGAQGAPGAPNARTPGDARVAVIQAEVDGAMGKMRENVTNLAQRGDDLGSLQDKTEDLAGSAQKFNRGANKVRQRMRWQEMKMRIWIGVGIVVLLAIIIIPAVVTTR